MATFPVLAVALRIEGRPCLVVGGGPVAQRKVRQLQDAGADVIVVAPTITEDLGDLVAEGRIEWRPRVYDTADLDDIDLVFTATDLDEVNVRVARDANDRRLFVNSADEPSNCTFFMTATVRRGPVTVAVSTGGSSPAVASYLRRRLERDLEVELAEVAELVAATRAEILDSGRSSEGLAWSQVVNDDLVALVRNGDTEGAADRLRSLVNSRAQ